VCVGLNIAAVDYNLIVILCFKSVFRRKSRNEKKIKKEKRTESILTE